MNKIAFYCLAAICGILVVSRINAQQDYIVGPEDIIEIKVSEHDEFETKAAVNPDGNIQMPIVGVVKVQGLTARQINEKITGILSKDYLISPVVTVNIKESKSNRFYVYGEVLSPGAYVISEGITLLKGITLAGGLSKFASAKVYIIRKENGKQQNLPANIDEIIKGKKEDIPLKAQDIIVVKERIL